MSEFNPGDDMNLEQIESLELEMEECTRSSARDIVSRPLLYQVYQDTVLDPLRCLCRGTGRADRKEDKSYIAFARKTEAGTFENLFSLTLEELEREFDRVVPFLTHDAYFTVNGMYRAAPFLSKTTGLPGVWRQEKHLRYLNTCYVDLDIGRTEGSAQACLSTEEAASQLQAMVREGTLPSPSVSVRSGRGMYLFWLLHDKDSDWPPRSYEEKLELYKNIQRGIVKRLRHLGADKNAIDAARLLRVPGTLHGITHQPATYKIRRSQEHFDQPACYTLQELEDWFGVSDGTSDATASSGKAWDYKREIISPGSAPRRANGPRTRDARRAEDMRRLADHQKGWVKGCRSSGLWLYASFLKGAGLSEVEVLQAVRAMAATCRPPYPSDPNDTPLKEIVKRAFESNLIFRNDNLCSNLDVTLKLARQLKLQSIVPSEARHEQSRQREVARQARHVAIREHVSQHGLRSSRSIAQSLREQGLTVSHWTVNADLKALEYGTSPHRRAGRKRRTEGDHESG